MEEDDEDEDEEEESDEGEEDEGGEALTIEEGTGDAEEEEDDEVRLFVQSTSIPLPHTISQLAFLFKKIFCWFLD